jgi:hypothetical protein
LQTFSWNCEIGGEKNLATQSILVGVAIWIKSSRSEQWLGWIPRERKEHFGHNDDLISRKLVLLDCPTQNLLRNSTGVCLVIVSINWLHAMHGTDVGGVKSVDTGVVTVSRLRQNSATREGESSRSLYMLRRFFFIQHPATHIFGMPVRHAAEDYFRNFKTRLAQSN